MKYRKKPVEVEVIQNKNDTNIAELKKFVGEKLITYVDEKDTVILMEIRTLEGNMTVGKNDYIIKGVQGEFYPCKPNIFKQTYEKVEE